MSLESKREAAAITIKPVDLPEIMPAVRVKQLTPFGNMHVKIVIDPMSGREREVFAQLGKGGDLANSDLEAICRLTSLYLRIHGSIDDVVNQLGDIGSSLSIPTKDGRINSLADGLARSIKKYQQTRKSLGLKGMLLGDGDHASTSDQSPQPERADPGARTMPSQYKIKCPVPGCGGTLIFEEGCVRCPACGHAEC